MDGAKGYEVCAHGFNYTVGGIREQRYSIKLDQVRPYPTPPLSSCPGARLDKGNEIWIAQTGQESGSGPISAADVKAMKARFTGMIVDVEVVY